MTRRPGSSTSRRRKPAFPYIPEANWKPAAQGFNTGIDFAAAAMPADPKVRAGALAATKGALIAWDPVAQHERWRVTFKGPWNGGVLATGGGLGVPGQRGQGVRGLRCRAAARSSGRAACRRASSPPPVTYSIKGEQYVAVLAGWGGIWALAPGILSEVGGPVRNVSRLLVFKFGASAQLPPEPPLARLPLDPPAASGTPEQLAEGAQQYARFCGGCHGDAAYGSTVLPDLRRSTLIADAQGLGEPWCMTAPCRGRAWSASRTS